MGTRQQGISGRLSDLFRWLGGLVIALGIAAPVQAACRDTTAQLRGDFGLVRFTVEIADTEALRSRGLMYRETLPKSAGMLFVYQRTKPLTFWMRNTYIPLDLIFLDETGLVTHVHADAVPLDESHIPSRVPARLVLEINGGLAGALGIQPGSQMQHPKILQSSAIWPC